MNVSVIQSSAVRARRGWGKGPTSRIIYYVVCSVLAILFLFPLIWTALMTLKSPGEAAAVPPTFLPSHISWTSYVQVFGAGIFGYLANSTVVVLMTVLIVAILSVLGGYGFSRFSFPGKNIIFVLILVTLMIPFQSILTPLFLLLHFIGLDNTLLGLSLVYVTFQLPVAIFLLRNSFDNVPRELEEAALIDGCSSWQLLWRVMLPVVFPGIVTAVLFAFFNTWNEFLAALIFITDNDKYTLPVYLVNLESGLYGQVNLGALYAGLMITIIPCIVIFLLLQRYYINGLIAGSVKA
ncbi:carbohydrate ABC transporter permease [Ktedonosporobacter rubrisoli]|uniref:Carbohydrate ABC transporter permease n=1 Tax=Ktedonosporobacter rubrisoli TaxID=2509675 RepID=A0A4P6K450_KTERU|nr:carbohydrate ABC transporter permease [Ktedonosporobacter rubrisoli]QBD82944.1 carbohydrate ABC transporter permease [Ktedonosporobacter rubrisoli]